MKEGKPYRVVKPIERGWVRKGDTLIFREEMNNNLGFWFYHPKHRTVHLLSRKHVNEYMEPSQ